MKLLDLKPGQAVIGITFKVPAIVVSIKKLITYSYVPGATHEIEFYSPRGDVDSPRRKIVHWHISAADILEENGLKLL